MARFLNSPINSHEVFVIRMSDTHNTNVDRLVWWYLRRAYPGYGGRTGINDYYSRTGRWPTIKEAIRENKRVFVFAQDKLCNAYCRNKYRFFLRVSTILFIFLHWHIKLNRIRFAMKVEPYILLTAIYSRSHFKCTEKDSLFHA